MLQDIYQLLFVEFLDFLEGLLGDGQGEVVGVVEVREDESLGAEVDLDYHLGVDDVPLADADEYRLVGFGLDAYQLFDLTEAHGQHDFLLVREHAIAVIAEGFVEHGTGEGDPKQFVAAVEDYLFHLSLELISHAVTLWLCAGVVAIAKVNIIIGINFTICPFFYLIIRYGAKMTLSATIVCP